MMYKPIIRLERSANPQIKELGRSQFTHCSYKIKAVFMCTICTPVYFCTRCYSSKGKSAPLARTLAFGYLIAPKAIAPKVRKTTPLAKTFLTCTISWLVVLRLNVPVNNFSVMSGRSHRFLGN